MRVLDVKGVLGIDKSALPTLLLHFGDHLQRQRGFARRLRAIDLNHAAAWQTANAQRNVKPERAGGDHLNILDHLALTQAHDGAFAKLFLDLRECDLQRFGFFAVGGAGGSDRCVHENLSLNINLLGGGIALWC